MAEPPPHEEVLASLKQNKQCIRATRPNRMTFTDALGQEHNIYIPFERYEEAMEMFRREDWEGLKGFERFGKLIDGVRGEGGEMGG